MTRGARAALAGLVSLVLLAVVGVVLVRSGVVDVPWGEGCTATVDHVHQPWEVATARGRLNPATAAAWSRTTWIGFLTFHKITQTTALRALREWAVAEGLEAPSSLVTSHCTAMPPTFFATASAAARLTSSSAIFAPAAARTSAVAAPRPDAPPVMIAV